MALLVVIKLVCKTLARGIDTYWLKVKLLSSWFYFPTHEDANAIKRDQVELLNKGPDWTIYQARCEISFETLQGRMFPRLSRVCRMYVGLMKTHPWRTQALTTGALMGGGDFIAQVGISKVPLKDYDYPRTARFLAAGFFVFGPSMHLWYSFLDHHIKGSLRKIVLKKLLLDQGLFLPTYLASFLVLMAALRGDEKTAIMAHLKADFEPMLLTSYSLWPTVQAVSFAMVPGQFRVLVINLVCLFWNTYLSWKSEQR